MLMYGGNSREIPMRLVHLMIAGAVLLAATPSSRAQSAYDYPWCALYTNRSGAQACYYTSYQQCMATMRGIGAMHCW